jgi:ankyrin repeat protein
VVDFLLRHGVGIDAKLPHDGQTGLHWAAYGGHPETVKLLLVSGAPVNATDERYGGTPLEWALYQWGNSPLQAERGSYYETVALLIQAGAKLHDEWFQEDDEERQCAVRRLRSDPRMRAALRGETPKK